MTYPESLQWMYAQLPMYHRVGAQAFKKDLSNTQALAQYLGNPHNQFKSIHVAGTNGKGSTSHMLASVLQEAGYKVGLYTSPHLKDFRERIKINGGCISKRNVSSFITKNQSFLEKQGLSFFEMTVGLAFHYFAKSKVDIAVIEVGLGGRLDSTNIIIPELSIITNIGYDHMNMLGNTLPEIAFEKAGIIKKGIPVVIGEKQEETTAVFEKIAKSLQAPISFASDSQFSLPSYELKGNYQVHNVKTVLSALNILQQKGWNCTQKAIEKGLIHTVSNTGLQGRWQKLGENPLIICDTAHNKDGLKYTMQQIKEQSFEHLHIVLGVVNDKDLDSVLPLFPISASYYFCQPNIPRALDREILQKKAAEFGLKGQTYSSVKRALSKAKKLATLNDFIYIGGSTFVVAEVV
jgi:dihydrofolate synthase / folylpolyglutamate synthase